MNNNAKYLTEWGKNSSFLFNTLAPGAVASVDPLFAVFQALRGRQTSPEAQAYAAILSEFPGNEQWAEYYHDQDKLFWDFGCSVLHAMEFSDDDEENILSLMLFAFHAKEFLTEDALNAVTPDEMAEAHKLITDALNPLFRASSESLRRQLAGEDDPEPTDGYAPLVRCPAVKFMVRVFLPCAASFQTTPGILLKNAVKGDEKALERLLIIDKHALFLPEVAALCNVRIATDFTRYQKTIPEYQKKSPPVITKRKLKQTVGTVLYEWIGSVNKQCHTVGDPKLAAKIHELNTLPISKIQELFTAYGRDSGALASHETDPDVNDFDAFQQAIHRMKKDLPPMPWQ